MSESLPVKVTDRTVHNKCSGCGECCPDLLPLSERELSRIKEYARQHNLKENRHFWVGDPYAIDATCPFRNEKERKCDIYPVRPLICREFLCNQPVKKIRHNRDLITQSRIVYSLRKEVFGNPESVNLICKALKLKTPGGKHNESQNN